MAIKTLRSRTEIFLVIAFIVLGFLVVITSLRYGFGTLDQPGPGLYPFFVGLSILLTSIFHFFKVMMGPASAPVFSEKNSIRTFSFMVLTFILWIVAMPYLGYILVTLAGTYSFCKIMKLEGWKKPLALSVTTCLLVYLLFDCFVYIDFPRGIFG